MSRSLCSPVPAGPADGGGLAALQTLPLWPGTRPRDYEAQDNFLHLLWNLSPGRVQGF